jgi:hypothetical protein
MDTMSVATMMTVDVIDRVTPSPTAAAPANANEMRTMLLARPDTGGIQRVVMEFIGWVRDAGLFDGMYP